MICEVGQNASAGTSRIDHAIEAYDLAASLGKPMAATASGQDWAFVKQNNCEDLVRFWIALAYAYGERFMVPHLLGWRRVTASEHRIRIDWVHQIKQLLEEDWGQSRHVGCNRVGYSGLGFAWVLGSSGKD